MDQNLGSKDKPEQALEVLNKQLESIGIDNFHYNAVTTLKSKLEAKSLPFPHDIPKKVTSLDYMIARSKRNQQYQPLSVFVFLFADSTEKTKG